MQINLSRWIMESIDTARKWIPFMGRSVKPKVLETKHPLQKLIDIYSESTREKNVDNRVIDQKRGIGKMRWNVATDES